MMKSQTSTAIFDQHASVSKLVFLAIISIALCSFGPLTIFAPVPIAIAFLLYGRVMAFSVGILSVGILWGLSVSVKGIPLIVTGMYFIAFLYALLVSEIIFRNVNPVKGLMNAGLALVILCGSTLMAYNQLATRPLKAEIANSASVVMEELKKQKKDSTEISPEEQRAFDDFVNKPEVLTEKIYSSLPLIVFVFSYLGLWVCLYVTLRNSIIWRFKVSYDFSLKDLTQFRTPEFFVYPLILSLVLLLGVDYGLPKESEVVGKNLLYCLGIFYLFQGFGVYNEFLKYLRIGGFIKTLFIAFTLVLAYNFLAILGIFDLWFDFRRFFTKTKKDEGDIL
jgi:hypothetical protein